MAESSVIKEFLIALGFKVDEKGLKTFTGTIDGATTAVTRLVTTLAGASLTIAAGVSAFASNLEDLYFASQRIGSSADSIKAAEYAARDFGASAGELRGSLEGIARFLRDNPGGEGFLQSLGVETRDIHGNIKDTADLLTGLGQRLRSMPWYQARQYASVLGIDENTLRAITNGDFARRVEQNRQTLSRSGLDQATKDAHAFMEQLRDIGLQFETLSVQVQAELMRRLGPDLAKFSQWFEKNAPMIAKRIVDLAEAVVDFGEDAGPYLKKTVDYFVELDRATDGWSTKLLIGIAALKTLGGGNLLKSLPGLASAGAVAGAGAGGWWAGGKINEWINTQLSQATGHPTSLGSWVYDALHPEESGADMPEWRRKEMETQNAARMSGRELAVFAMDFFKSKGWSNAASAGIVSNGIAESGLNPAARGDRDKSTGEFLAKGIFQWHPDRQREFERWAGFTLDDPRADLMKQLEFAHYELTQGAEQKAGRLLQASQNAGQAGSVASQYWLRPAAADAEAAKRGAMAMQLDQKTEIHVHGSGDANSAAQAVAGAQGRVNEELVRNMTSAVQ